MSLDRGKFKKITWQSAVVLLLCIATVEIALRLFSLLPLSSATYRYDPDIDYRIQPGVLGVTEGFNDRRSDEKFDQPRILFVGDSFTFGTYEPEYVFPGLVEQGLKRNGIEAAVYSRGLPGAGTSTYLKLTKAYLHKLDPQVIVLTLYIGNDIEQSHPRQNTRLYAGTVATINRPEAFGFNLRDFFVYYAIRRMYNTLNYRLKGDSSALPRSAVKDGCVTGAFRPYEMYHVGRQEIEPMHLAPSRFISMAYDGLRQRLHEFRRLTEGRRVLVLLAPSKIQVDPMWLDDIVSFWSLNAGDYDSAKPNRILAQDLENLGLDFIDLSRDFSRESTERPVYDCLDTHWNREGNAIAARAILGWLQDKLTPAARTQQ
jgi:hypothetical protein